MSSKLMNPNPPQFSVLAVDTGALIAIDYGTPTGTSSGGEALETPESSTGGARGAPLGPPGRGLSLPGSWVTPRHQPWPSGRCDRVYYELYYNSEDKVDVFGGGAATRSH